MGVLQFVKPYRKEFTIGSVAKFTEAYLELYLPILMARILDIGIPNHDKSLIIKTGIQMFIFALLGFACATICQYSAAHVSYGTGSNIRNAVMRHISSFSYEEIDKFGTSSLINRITTDTNNIQQMVAMTIRLVTRAPFICIGAVIMSLRIDRELAGIFIIIIPILGAVLYAFMRFTSPLYKKAQEKLDRFALVVRETLSGVRVIRAFANTGQQTQKGKTAANDVCDSYTRVGSIFAWMQPINSIVLNCAIVLVIYLSASKVYAGSITSGKVLSLTIYATKILYALVVIANLIVLFTKASSSSKRIMDILNTKPNIADKPNAVTEISQPSDENTLKFEKVTFAYNEGKPVLEDISFEMKSGSMLGIVGVTGSGKTTLLNLIQRFYLPQSGSIYYNGFNIIDMAENSLRKEIGFVPQTNVLFSGTIADNLRMSKPTATDEEIIKALKTAQCWEFVKNLPEKHNSVVFEGGKNFSGGQKQRLTIARALVKNPRLLLLDDSLSALDYQTDLALRNSLKESLPNTSTIIVSQRISSVVSADKIIVFDNGKLVGMGTHEELLKDCPQYVEIYSSQMDSDKEVS